MKYFLNVIEKTISLALMILCLSAPSLAQDADRQSSDEHPKITISKETTWFTEPLTDNGSVDYVEAINRHFSEGVTPENNLVTALLEVVGCELEDEAKRKEMSRWLKVNELPQPEKPLIDFYDFAIDDFPEDRLFEIDELVSTFPWSREEYPIVAGWIDLYSPQVDKFVESLEHKTRYFYPYLNSDENPGSIIASQQGDHSCRKVMRFLVTRSLMRLHNREIAESQRDTLAGRKMANLLCDGQSLICVLIASAIRGMTFDAEMQMCLSKKSSAEDLERYANEVRKLMYQPSLRPVFNEYERWLMLDFAIQVKNNKEAFIFDKPSERVMFDQIRKHIDWDSVLTKLNDRIDKRMKLFDHDSFYERLKALQGAAEVAERHELNPTEAWAQLLASEGGKSVDVVVHVIEHRMWDVTNCHHCYKVWFGEMLMHDSLMETNIALHRYRFANGEFPDSLDELTPEYIDEIPTDLFANKAMNYKKSGEHFVLYSVGEDLKDHEGSIARVRADLLDEDGSFMGYEFRIDLGVTSDLEYWNSKFELISSPQ
jgi:hypothetical protein